MSTTGKTLAPYNTTTIISSIENVMKSGNINHLTKEAYTFLVTNDYDIAHYSVHGFRDVYDKKIKMLCDKIIAKKDWIEQRYTDKWFKSSYGEDYENSIYVIGIAICNLAKQYKSELETNEGNQQKVEDLILADRIAKKYGYCLTKVSEEKSL